MSTINQLKQLKDTELNTVKLTLFFFVPAPPQTWICKPQWEAVWPWGACWASAYTFCPTGIEFSNIYVEMSFI